MTNNPNTDQFLEYLETIEKSKTPIKLLKELRDTNTFSLNGEEYTLSSGQQKSLKNIFDDSKGLLGIRTRTSVRREVDDEGEKIMLGYQNALLRDELRVVIEGYKTLSDQVSTNTANIQKNTLAIEANTADISQLQSCFNEFKEVVEKNFKGIEELFVELGKKFGENHEAVVALNNKFNKMKKDFQAVQSDVNTLKPMVNLTNSYNEFSNDMSRFLAEANYMLKTRLEPVQPFLSAIGDGLFVFRKNVVGAISGGLSIVKEALDNKIKPEKPPLEEVQNLEERANGIKGSRLK